MGHKTEKQNRRKANVHNKKICKPMGKYLVWWNSSSVTVLNEVKRLVFKHCS